MIMQWSWYYLCKPRLISLVLRKKRSRRQIAIVRQNVLSEIPAQIYVSIIFNALSAATLLFEPFAILVNDSGGSSKITTRISMHTHWSFCYSTRYHLDMALNFVDLKTSVFWNGDRCEDLRQVFYCGVCWRAIIILFCCFVLACASHTLQRWMRRSGQAWHAN